MKRSPSNVAASIRGRLLRLAKERGEDFQLVLTRYAGERLLFRLAESPHAAQFVLKGATLFSLWTGAPHRATRDIDLLGFGDPSAERVLSLFADVVGMDVEEDGAGFDRGSLEVAPIREDSDYGGQQVTLVAVVSSARVAVKVDVAFGDVVTPAPAIAELPTLLGSRPPRLRVYPRETVVAEKVEAMVRLGLANSRMKDFFDLLVLAATFEFDGRLLARAIRATFERRATPFVEGAPVALTPRFAEDPSKQAQWRAFLHKSGAPVSLELPSAIAEVSNFAGPVLAAALVGGDWEAKWPRGGPWSG